MEAMYQKRFQEVQQVWEPKEHHGKNRKKLTKIIEDKYNVKLDTYEKLYRWSVENLCEFWAEMWDFFGIISSKRFDKVLDLTVPMDQSPEWFVGARLNFAENLLKYRDDRIAVTVDGEESEIKTFTFAQMFEDARLLAAAFRKMGLKKGDVVACFMSNRKEALTAMHAATSTGAIWTASLPYLGPDAVIQRFKIVNPKILVAVDRFVAGGNEVEMLTKVKSIVKGLPTLEKVIIVETRPDSHLRDISDVKNCVFLKDFLKTGLDEDGTVPPMVFEQVAFSHPVTISYTSGTTGQPKPLVHGSGTLFATANTFGINYDCDRDASWLSVSAAGWASWNIFAVFPFLGNSVLLYDGDPYFLSPTHIWDLIDKHHITHAFFLARVVDELRKRNHVPTEKHDLSSLKLLIAGGSVVKPTSYDFMNSILRKETLFANCYGCTEFLGVSLVNDISLPAHKTEFNGVTLGTNLEVVDDKGKPVIGQFGEIILSKPIPGMTLRLWNDDDGSIFRKKYFSYFPGSFAMNDYGVINPYNKNWVVLCRSDETLKLSSARFGSSEIYDVVELFPEVQDSLCVSQHNKELDERAVLFLKMKEGHAFTEELADRIRSRIADELTAFYVPAVVVDIPEIPYNMSGKKMEIVVKKIINNMPYTQETVVNPECLEFYKAMAEQQDFKL